MFRRRGRPPLLIGGYDPAPNEESDHIPVLEDKVSLKNVRTCCVFAPNFWKSNSCFTADCKRDGFLEGQGRSQFQLHTCTATRECFRTLPSSDEIHRLRGIIDKERRAVHPVIHLITWSASSLYACNSEFSLPNFPTLKL